MVWSVWIRRWLGMLGDAGKAGRQRNLWFEPGRKGNSVLKKALRWNGQKGQGLVEYALIIALVAIVVIAILVLLGPQIGNLFSSITRAL